MPDDAKQQILDTALSLFAKQGFSKTSINDIVRASGLSKGGVYWHFTSKDEIIASIFDRFFDPQMIAIRTVLENTELSAPEKLVQLINLSANNLEETVAQFPTLPEFYALALREEPLRDRLIHYFDLYQTSIEQLVIQGIAAGEWRQIDPRSTAMTIIALFEGTLMVWGMMPNAYRLSDQIDKAVSLLMEGLKANEPNGG